MYPRFLFVAALAAGCGPAVQPAHPPSVSIAIPSSTAASALPPTGTRCPELSTKAKSAAKALFQAERQKAPAGPADGYDDGLFAVPSIVGACFEDAAGAFVITLKEVHLQEGWPQIEVQWALEHVDPGWKSTRVVPTEKLDDSPTSGDYNWLNGYPGTMVAEVDGLTINGKLVVFTRVHGTYHEDAAFSRGRLFTFEGDRIVPYAPAANIDVERLVDADADGITDLLTYGPFDTVGEQCGSGFGYRIAGPLLLAHGLADGTYSMKDDTAAAHAKKQCPRMPASIVVKGSEDDTAKSTHDVACLRLWGIGTGSIVSQIDRECPALPESHHCQPGLCSDHDLLRTWAAMEVPLTLR